MAICSIRAHANYTRPLGATKNACDVSKTENSDAEETEEKRVPLKTIDEAISYITTNFKNQEETLWIADALNDNVGINMAIIGDKLLEAGYRPNGFDQKKDREIKEAIIDFEKGNKTVKQAIADVELLTGKKVTKYELENYWRAEDLNEFISRLTIIPIENWEDIDKEKAEELLKEIYQDLTNSAVILRNGEALEKRYKKPEGTVTAYIFQDDLDVKQIIDKLEEDETTYL